jgi:hypothetical protein
MNMDAIALIIVPVRVVVFLLCGLVLLKSWVVSKKRYFSDLPFVLALMFLTLFVAKCIDFYILVNFTSSSTSAEYLAVLSIRYVIMAINTIEILFAVLIVWNRSRVLVNLGIIAGYSAVWTLWLLSAKDFSSLSRSLYLVAPVLILLVATFTFTYFQKRLTSKFNSLHVTIGTVIYVVSQIIRPALANMGGGDWGLSWISEIIDLVGWLFIFRGFIEPTIQAKKRGLVQPLNAS